MRLCCQKLSIIALDAGDAVTGCYPIEGRGASGCIAWEEEVGTAAARAEMSIVELEFELGWVIN